MRRGQIEIVSDAMRHDVRIFEEDRMTRAGIVDFFNYLIAYDLAWRMGHIYVTTARYLIEEGHCSFPCKGQC
jgi:hypothetical protein